MIAKPRLDKFIETINKLYEFLHIFKSDLMGIEIDKKKTAIFGCVIWLWCMIPTRFMQNLKVPESKN